MSYKAVNLPIAPTLAKSYVNGHEYSTKIMYLILQNIRIIRF